MTDVQWNIFCCFRNEFKSRVAKWDTLIGEELLPLQKSAADIDGVPPYPVETPIVYNRTLDDVTQQDDIRLIVIGDNPGKNEQLEKNRRYLVGQAGKLADGFFRRNPVLGIDFRKNVIILNKTPIHTAKTKQLSYVLKNGSSAIRKVFEESQKWCAQSTAQLHQDLNANTTTQPVCDLWLVGYGELGKKGLFSIYGEELATHYAPLSDVNPTKKSLLVFQHFSMNRFSIDLKKFLAKQATVELSEKLLAENLRELGQFHRKIVLGF